MSEHSAAFSLEKGTSFVIRETMTSELAPEEILLEARAVAVNPIGHYQRDLGFPLVHSYPAIFGNDVSGVILKVGSKITDLKPGTRVCALASSYYLKANKFAAFQKCVVVPAVAVTPIPESVSFEQACTIPLCLMTAWVGLTLLGYDPNTSLSSKENALLVWGGSSCVGTAVTQAANLLGLKVYATASKNNHNYLQRLGAHKVFDYHDDSVIKSIVSAAKSDNVNLRHGYLASGDVLEIQKTMAALHDHKAAKIVSAPILPQSIPEVDNIEIFSAVLKTAVEYAHMEELVLANWLKKNLANGKYKPSPTPIVIGSGLNNLDVALNMLRDKGASASKYVVVI